MSATQDIARAYARGLLSWPYAEASIVMQAVRSQQRNASSPHNGDLAYHIKVERHLFDMFAHAEAIRMQGVISEIEQTVWSLAKRAAGTGMVRSVLLAQAHEVNGQHGFLVPERDVKHIVKDVLRRVNGWMVRRGG